MCIVHVIPRFNGNYSHLGDQGVGEGGLAVVDVSDHGHVPDVLLLVHAFPHLVGCEVNLQNVSHEKILEAEKEGVSGGTGRRSFFVQMLNHFQRLRKWNIALRTRKSKKFQMG